MFRFKFIVIAILALSANFSFAQVEQIKLEQVTGAFTTESLILAEGEYQFDIHNKDVEHEVGFVIVPKGKYDPSNHIKEGYVTKPVATGMNSMTQVVNLPAGEYEYFCPLNKTEKYPLTVSNKVEKIELSQVPSHFTQKNVTVTEGLYQFEITNNGVDHNVGFVLVPKGQYAPENHIKTAYVKSPVANGTTSKSHVVNLEAGEYEYFCPLNKTPKYSLTVKK